MADQNKQADKDFWNAKAATFPRYSEGEHNYEARILALVRGMGVDFHGKSVLDVGCGTGMYTIRIAKDALKVFALDLSEEMLRIFKEDAAAQGLANIEFILSDWMDYASPPPCDYVFCSMSAAIRNDAGREKLITVRKAAVVYIDFVRRAPSNVMQGLYERYAIIPKKFDNAVVMREWLARKGITHASRHVEDGWDVPWERDALVRSCALTLQRHGVEADRDLLAAHVAAFKRDDGLYHETTEFSAEILLWQSPDHVA